MKPRLILIITLAVLLLALGVPSLQGVRAADPGSSGNFLSNAVAADLGKPAVENTFPRSSQSPAIDLVRAATAKSVKEQTFEPVLETQQFYGTDYGVYAWLHMQTDYAGQNLRIWWHWIRPDGLSSDSISPWWTFGGTDVFAASWIFVYGAGLPLGQWTVEYWVQPYGGDWQYLITTTFNLASGTACTQYLANGGFETGSQGWQASGNVIVDSTHPHWGSKGTILGGGQSQSYFLYQDVTLPTSYTQSPILALYYGLYSEDSDTFAYDFLRVQIRDVRGTLLRTLDVSDNTQYYFRYPPDAWQPLTWDLSDFAGQTIRVYLEAETDSSLITRWYIDDVSLTACPSQPQTQEEMLAKRFAPIVFMHPGDGFLPNQVTILLDDSQLIDSSTGQVAVENPTEQLFENEQYHASNYYLDIEGKILDLLNHSSQPYRDYFQQHGGSYPVMVYAHVAEANGELNLDGCSACRVVQYWLFYYFNDWNNLHEGDWEMVQVVLDRDQNDRPVRVAYSQHEKFPLVFPGGTKLNWEDVPFRTGDHPWVFVAKGSHASYFDPAAYRAVFPDETASNGAAILPPNVDDPNIDLLSPDTRRWNSQSPFLIQDGAPGWVDFQGTWGHDGYPLELLGGKPPKGPRYSGNGQKWDRPLEWARQLPFDNEYWADTNQAFQIQLAANLELHLYDAQNRHVGLNGSGGIDLQIPGRSYHNDPTGPATFIQVTSASLASGYRLELHGLASGTFDLALTVPDPAGGSTYAVAYYGVAFGLQTVARLSLAQQAAYQPETLNLVLDVDYDGDGNFETSVSPSTSSQAELDTTPPAVIADLHVQLSPNRPNSVRLTWTAPADTGGSAGVIRCEVRYAPFPITEANWDSATRSPDIIIPNQPGQLEIHDVTGLNLAQATWFAVRSIDANHNISALSNAVRLPHVYLPLTMR